MSVINLREKRRSRIIRSLKNFIISKTTSIDLNVRRTPPLKPPSRLPLTTTIISPPEIDYPRATLLGLPAELRLEIYSYIFPAQTTLDRLRAVQDDTCLSSPQHTVLLVCKQLFHECYPLLQRTILIVPDGRINSVFPLYRDRLAEATKSGALERLQVKDVVIREFADHLTFWGSTPTMNSEVWLPIDVDTIYLSLCLCRCDLWGFRDEGPASWQWGNRLLHAVKRCLNGVRSLRRVVIYFCGLPETVRFGVNRQTGDLVRLIKGNLKKWEGRAMGEQGWIALEREGVFDDGDEKSMTRDEVAWYNVCYLEEDLEVEVEFWDSWSTCTKGCVLH